VDMIREGGVGVARGSRIGKGVVVQNIIVFHSCGCPRRRRSYTLLHAQDVTSYRTTTSYAGTIAATLLQKSHLAPRPASHVYAFANVKLFLRLGPVRYWDVTVAF
jgi:hypothetical protein